VPISINPGQIQSAVDISGGGDRERAALRRAFLRGFTLHAGAQVQFDLILLPHGSREIAALLATSIV
jgi:hypothetical protein